MHFRITSDSNTETRVGNIVDLISETLRKSFLNKSYGSSIKGIVIVFMCRDPKLAFKQSIKFSKIRKYLYLDVMIDYQIMLSAINDNQRLLLMKGKMLEELQSTFKKYKFEDFDTERFIQDLTIAIQLS